MIIVSEVPEFVSQLRDDDCGSVALASLLNHAGYQVSAVDVDRHIYDPVLGGSLLPDMENYAKKIGAKTKAGRGDLNLLRNKITQGRPILISIDLGWGAWRRPHYVVVFGFDSTNFLLRVRQDDIATWTADKLAQRWQKMGSLYLYLED